MLNDCFPVRRDSDEMGCLSLDFGTHLDVRATSQHFFSDNTPDPCFHSFTSFYKVIIAVTACTTGATHRTNIPPATPTVGTVFYLLAYYRMFQDPADRCTPTLKHMRHAECSLVNLAGSDGCIGRIYLCVRSHGNFGFSVLLGAANRTYVYTHCSFVLLEGELVSPSFCFEASNLLGLTHCLPLLCRRCVMICSGTKAVYVLVTTVGFVPKTTDRSRLIC